MQKPFLETAAVPVAIVMLVLWAFVTFVLGGPGWIHLFLTLGVFLLIWGIVARGTSNASGTDRFRPRR